MRPLAEAACELPWLAPCAGSLVALTREPSDGLWTVLRSDPGLVLLLLRQSNPQATAATKSVYTSLFHDPGLVELVLDCLARPASTFVDWRQPLLLPSYRSAYACAYAAEAIARQTGRCHVELAWMGGLLANLGSLAIAATNNSGQGESGSGRFGLNSECPIHKDQRPAKLDPFAVGRRLAASWRLSARLGAVAGHLGLPLRAAKTIGADPDFFLVVQLAVLVAEEAGFGNQLAIGSSRQEIAQALQLETDEVRAIVDEVKNAEPSFVPPVDWQAPESMPLLGDLLRLALQNRRLTQWFECEKLQGEVDALHEAVQRQREGEEERLKESKLRALAEFAAGAGHEINNPLAVISGQAQYLMPGEQDPARRKSLQTIVGQTQRIHQTLTQLMQFARPPVPRKQRIDLGGLISEIVADLQALADERQVRLVVAEAPIALTLLVDPGQMRAAVSGLVRNAIEAAPPGGWASLRAERVALQDVVIIVEDNGPGLKADDREHLFDPFYSGRKAGRGRGLGLPAAWQLARQHGGDVRFDVVENGPTRFLLTLPPAAVADILPLRIASGELRMAN